MICCRETKVSLDLGLQVYTLGIMPNKQTKAILTSEQKHRMTHQRQVIFEEIMKMNSHPTAEGL